MPKSDPEFTASAMAACPAARASGIRAASETAGVSDPDRGRWPCHWRTSAASRSQGGASPASPPSWRCSTRTAAPARSTVSKEKGSGEEQSTSVIGGLDDWNTKGCDPVDEPRLLQLVRAATGVGHIELRTPPRAAQTKTQPDGSIKALRFPQRSLAQKVTERFIDGRPFRARPLVH